MDCIYNCLNLADWYLYVFSHLVFFSISHILICSFAPIWPCCVLYLHISLPYTFVYVSLRKFGLVLFCIYIYLYPTHLYMYLCANLASLCSVSTDISISQIYKCSSAPFWPCFVLYLQISLSHKFVYLALCQFGRVVFCIYKYLYLTSLYMQLCANLALLCSVSTDISISQVCICSFVLFWPCCVLYLQISLSHKFVYVAVHKFGLVVFCIYR